MKGRVLQPGGTGRAGTSFRRERNYLVLSTVAR
jgi:hypothetical protein